MSTVQIHSFERWCRLRGGKPKLDRREKHISCRFPRYLAVDDIDMLLAFASEMKDELKRRGYNRMCVRYVEPVADGRLKEWEEVCYLPREDEVEVVAHYYSDYGKGGTVEGLPKTFTHEELIDTSRVVFKGEMDAEFAKPEWWGRGETSTRFTFSKARDAPKIVEKALHIAREKAIDYANDALDYIKPPE